MSERRKIMELFEQQKEYADERINTGIELYRKGYAEIRIIDSKGNVVPNAKISVEQKSHEFRFGANIFMLDELETPQKNDAYKTHFANLFNMATLPFYWQDLEPEQGKPRYAKDSPKIYRRPAPDLCLEFCEQHGIEPREHALAYEHFFPDWLKDASVQKIKLAYEKRCKEISERYADKIPTIEVTNEMEWDEGKTAFYDEPDYVEWCFKTAEKYFPANQLVINDWTGLPWGDKCRPSDKYYAYIEANLLKGARIDAIGMQFHMFSRKEDEYNNTRAFYNPRQLYAHMDLYSNFGKPLQITEVTVPAYSNDPEDEEIQAEIIKKLYSIWFSHKNVEQIIYWNLADGYAAFAPQGDMSFGENYFYGGLLRFDLTPKPAYYAIKDLIFKEWHTSCEETTNDCGKATFKGFYGEYDLKIEANGKTVTKSIKLKSKGKNTFTVQI